MRSAILVDTGPIVAYLCEDESHHAWAVEQFKAHARPLYTCEAVLVEAAFLLRRLHRSHTKLLALLESGATTIAFDLEAESATIAALMTQYSDLPMDLADACLVRMAEQHEDSRVLTLDSDFHIYRKHDRETIDVIMPSWR